jgi:hypothetical protein
MSGVRRALATIRVPLREGGSPSVTANGSGYSMSPRATAVRERRALSRSRTSGATGGGAARHQAGRVAEGDAHAQLLVGKGDGLGQGGGERRRVAAGVDAVDGPAPVA